ncbi:hypothetical protein HO173_009249 [Letharia columbiana]|uniref:Uncharacterized protein n=1 Tax=Letharia columbiana TaxID=112416 RepID=A0A8H6L1Z2_9LECA|nr:uncharacterized protein HO173_009249 [Letharia columbiana]KAF6232581.1 hypothetical protein HO173_009249 [Letharia columbiana]
MQVLSLAMPRTGTVTMQAALEILGCKPTYHGYTPLYNIDECAKWICAFDAKYHNRGPLFTREDWDDLLGNYQAVTDSPAICFAEELIKAYPEAKVVLVERNIESWYQSFDGMIQEMYNPMIHVLRLLDPQVLGPTATMFNYVYKDRRGFCRTDNKDELQHTARTLYREHYAHVRRVCPKDRLLDFRLEDGWGPLCEFLGKEKPDVPFPRLNEGAALAERFKEFQKRSMLLVLRNLTLVGVSAWVVLLAVGWARR